MVAFQKLFSIVLVLALFSSAGLGQETLFSDDFNDGTVSDEWITSGDVSEHDGELDIHNPGDCNYDRARLELGDQSGDLYIDQEWRTAIGGWYESPRYRVIEDGTNILFENYPKSKDGSYQGSYSDTVTVDGDIEVEFLVDPSGACGNGDHYYTDLYLGELNISITGQDFCNFRGLINECK